MRFTLIGAAALGLVLLLRRTAGLRRELHDLTPSPDPWRPLREPKPAPAPARSWVEPNYDGTCPPTHPVKAKETSGIYHLPGMNAYARTRPDRCYASEVEAEADGFTRAKR